MTFTISNTYANTIGLSRGTGLALLSTNCRETMMKANYSIIHTTLCCLMVWGALGDADAQERVDGRVKAEINAARKLAEQLHNDTLKDGPRFGLALGGHSPFPGLDVKETVVEYKNPKTKEVSRARLVASFVGPEPRDDGKIEVKIIRDNNPNLAASVVFAGSHSAHRERRPLSNKSPLWFQNASYSRHQIQNSPTKADEQTQKVFTKFYREDGAWRHTALHESNPNSNDFTLLKKFLPGEEAGTHVVERYESGGLNMPRRVAEKKTITNKRLHHGIIETRILTEARPITSAQFIPISDQVRVSIPRSNGKGRSRPSYYRTLPAVMNHNNSKVLYPAVKGVRRLKQPGVLKPSFRR